MADFYVSITDSGSYDITANGNTIVVIDHSPYDINTESGHTQADFNYYYKVSFLNPDGTSYVFSAMGDGDEVIIAPAASTLPITTTYTYSTGDGVYTVVIYSVPTYDPAATYTEASLDYVYSGGFLYRAVGSVSGILPGTTADWVLITDPDTLPSKYRLSQKFAVTCAAEQCYINLVLSGNCDPSVCFTDICKNPYFQKYAKLRMILDRIEELVNINAWDEVIHAINMTSQLCCCNE